jgi:hypothetical protein
LTTGVRVGGPELAHFQLWGLTGACFLGGWWVTQSWRTSNSGVWKRAFLPATVSKPVKLVFQQLTFSPMVFQKLHLKRGNTLKPDYPETAPNSTLTLPNSNISHQKCHPLLWIKQKFSSLHPNLLIQRQIEFFPIEGNRSSTLLF